jgi:hypothetical protein
MAKQAYGASPDERLSVMRLNLPRDLTHYENHWSIPTNDKVATIKWSNR